MQYMTNVVQLPGRLGGGSPRRLWSSGCKFNRTILISILMISAKYPGWSWWNIPLPGKLAPRQDDRSVTIWISILIMISIIILIIMLIMKDIILNVTGSTYFEEEKCEKLGWLEPQILSSGLIIKAYYISKQVEDNRKQCPAFQQHA